MLRKKLLIFSDYVFSNRITMKVAHLKCVYERSGAQGLTDLLLSKKGGSTRVNIKTTSVDKVISHFSV